MKILHDPELRVAGFALFIFVAVLGAVLIQSGGGAARKEFQPTRQEQLRLYREEERAFMRACLIEQNQSPERCRELWRWR